MLKVINRKSIHSHFFIYGIVIHSGNFMRKMIIFFSFEILLICSFFTYKVYKQQQKEKFVEEYKLAILYKWQNRAFMTHSDHEERFHYQGADKCNLQELLIYLHVYNSIQNKNQLTIEDVQDYLSEEYDSEGRLRVYHRPDNIEDYIDIYPDIVEVERRFEDDFNGYLMSHGYPHVFRRMPYEEVKAALEEYKKSPEYEPPQLEERAKASSSGEGVPVELAQEIFLKREAMIEEGYSDEEIEKEMKKMIEEYEAQNN